MSGQTRALRGRVVTTQVPDTPSRSRALKRRRTASDDLPGPLPPYTPLQRTASSYMGINTSVLAESKYRLSEDDFDDHDDQNADSNSAVDETEEDNKKHTIDLFLGWDDAPTGTLESHLETSLLVETKADSTNSKETFEPVLQSNLQAVPTKPTKPTKPKNKVALLTDDMINEMTTPDGCYVLREMDRLNARQLRLFAMTVRRRQLSKYLHNGCIRVMDVDKIEYLPVNGQGVARYDGASQMRGHMLYKAAVRCGIVGVKQMSFFRDFGYGGKSAKQIMKQEQLDADKAASVILDKPIIVGLTPTINTML